MPKISLISLIDKYLLFKILITAAVIVVFFFITSCYCLSPAGVSESGILSSFRNTVSLEQALIDMGYTMLSEEKFKNWWETGFIDKKNASLPGTVFIRGKFMTGNRNFHKLDQYIMISEQNPSRPGDPVRGVFFKLYKNTGFLFSSGTGLVFPADEATYQFNQAFGNAIRVNPAVWDLWDLHNGIAVAPVPGRVFKTKIKKRIRKEYKKLGYYSVRVLFNSMPKKRNNMNIAIPAEAVTGHDITKETVVVVLEKDDNKVAAKVYWESEYNKSEDLHGKEIGFAVYDKNKRTLTSINLSKFSILYYLLGIKKTLRPEWYFKTVINKYSDKYTAKDNAVIQFIYGSIWIHYHDTVPGKKRSKRKG